MQLFYETEFYFRPLKKVLFIFNKINYIVTKLTGFYKKLNIFGTSALLITTFFCVKVDTLGKHEKHMRPMLELQTRCDNPVKIIFLQNLQISITICRGHAEKIPSIEIFWMIFQFWILVLFCKHVP